jgi:hypothetical protein
MRRVQSNGHSRLFSHRQVSMSHRGPAGLCTPARACTLFVSLAREQEQVWYQTLNTPYTPQGGQFIPLFHN